MKESRLFYFPPTYTSLGTLPAHHIEAKGAEEARMAAEFGGEDVTDDPQHWKEYDWEDIGRECYA